MVARGQMPARLNPVVQSTMNSVKLEPDENLQRESATVLAAFVAVCVDNGRAVVGEKVVTNLCRFVAASVADATQLSDCADFMDPEPVRTRGAKLALASIVQRMGSRLWETLPGLLALVTQPLHDAARRPVAAGAAGAGAGAAVASGTSDEAVVNGSLQSAACGAALMCTLAPHVARAQHQQLVNACPTLLTSLLATPHGTCPH